MMAPLREAFVRLDGRAIWCGIAGAPSDRASLVCVAGGPGTGHQYLLALAELADERQVVFYDALGAGRSERPEIPWTIEIYEREIGAVVSGLELGPYALFAHSSAGFAVLPHAASRPRGLTALVLAGTPVDIAAHTAHVHGLLAAMLPPAEREAFVRAEHDPRLRDVAHTKAVNTFMGRYMCNLRPFPSELIEAGRSFNHAAHQQMKGGWALYTTDLATWTFTARLGEIAVPVLFTFGGNDIISREAIDEASRLLPHCELAELAHSTHMPHLEEPEANLARVRAFLAAHDR